MARNFWLVISLGLLILYLPSLFTFFTHDDFFHLKISQAHTIGEFFNFFNLVSPEHGFGFYRPLTTQSYYFISRNFFANSPLPLHVISFCFFLAGTMLVYKFAHLLSGESKLARMTVIFYAFSAVHFGHMYFLGTFQELGLFVFYMLTAIYFFTYLLTREFKKYMLTLFFFVLALVSKETAVSILPALVLIWVYLKLQNREAFKFSGLIILLVPFALILGVYLYLHVFYYGIASGDSYTMDFSVRKFANTLFWYVLWSIGVPEMFVDFVGSGFAINFNLFNFWGREVYPILTFFCLVVLSAGYFTIRLVNKSGFKNFMSVSLFCSLWFITSLLPLLFFPLHKFSYNLTTPLFGTSLFLAFVTSQAKLPKVIVYTFIAFFLILNLYSIRLAKKTHWSVRGSQTAYRVYDFFKKNSYYFSSGKIMFYDTPDDNNLPWLPSRVIKDTLSNTNFFDVFFPGEFEVIYGNSNTESVNFQLIEARRFIGY